MKLFEWSSLARGKWIEAPSPIYEARITKSLPSQEGSGLKQRDNTKTGSGSESSLARGKWIEASERPEGYSTRERLPSQEGSGLKRFCRRVLRCLYRLPS